MNEDMVQGQGDRALEEIIGMRVGKSNAGRDGGRSAWVKRRIGCRGERGHGKGKEARRDVAEILRNERRGEQVWQYIEAGGRGSILGAGRQGDRLAGLTRTG